MEKELTREQEEYIWKVKNFHPLTREQQNEENYQFLKEKYWELIFHFTKKGDDKTVKQLQNSWVGIEKQYPQPKGNQSSLSDLSKNLEIGERTIYRALQAYDKFPQLDKIPEWK